MMPVWGIGSISYFHVLFYGLILAVICCKPSSIVYLLAFFSPFDYLFSFTFVEISLHGFTLTLKPVLFIMVVLIFFSSIMLVRIKKVSLSFGYNQLICLGFTVFCLVCFAWAHFKKTSSHLTEINMLANTSLLFFLPYYYKDKKVHLRELLLFFSLGLLLVVMASLVNCLLLNNWNNQAQANYFMMLLPLMIFAYAYYERPFSLIFGAVALAVYVALYFTLSRASWIGFVSAGMTYLLLSLTFYFKKNKASFRKLFLMLVLFSIIPFWIMTTLPNIRDEAKIFTYMGHKVDKKLIKDSSLIDTDNNFLLWVYYALGHQRTIAWRNAVNVFEHNPLKGHGLNYEASPMGVHSSFLKVFIASGVGGAFVFLGSLFLLLARLTRFSIILKSKPISLFSLAILFSILSWLIRSLTDTVLNEYIIWIICALSFFLPKIIVINPAPSKTGNGG